MKDFFYDSYENNIWSKQEIDEISKNVADYVMNYVSEKEKERKRSEKVNVECKLYLDD